MPKSVKILLLTFFIMACCTAIVIIQFATWLLQAIAQYTSQAVLGQDQPLTIYF